MKKPGLHYQAESPVNISLFCLSSATRLTRLLGPVAFRPTLTDGLALSETVGLDALHANAMPGRAYYKKVNDINRLTFKDIVTV